jgi:sugar lactone lactonase YvrE/thiol-disulfide isomerase/thioredoxin
MKSVPWLGLLVACALSAVAGRGLAGEDRHPFPQRLSIPDFPKEAVWLNTGGPLRKQDLKGKFVLLDFWTYCCINCMHILPELKKLERAYPDTLIVIGVHSAKFATEREAQNIEEAILRYEIEHPVVNDPEHRLWNTYGINSWPTVLLVDPEGYAVWGHRGEVTAAQVEAVLKRALPFYKRQGLLDDTPIRFDLLAHRRQPTPLRFPGKVLADAARRQLFISDSNHNRIVVATLEGQLLEGIGSGPSGAADGSFATATFDHPQGLALHGDTLFVADTENHLLRQVDLQQKTVTTVAGTGKQNRDFRARGGAAAKPRAVALNSPWDLWIHGEHLFIAMAGSHHIWRMRLDGSSLAVYAGNGGEDIVDGPLFSPRPFQPGYASFAQPSGLASDGEWLYVADSEGSSIRAVPFDPKRQVRTVIGTSQLPQARLFTFGDRDGSREHALLQHPLGVAYHDGTIYVADTYNNKVKAVDAKTGAVRTLAGTGKPGATDEPATFDEPGGLSYAAGRLYVADTNNHLIRTVDVATGKVATLQIAGLTPPTPATAVKKSSFSGAVEIKAPETALKAVDGKITLSIQLELPLGWKINPQAPMRYRLEAAGENGPVAPAALGDHAIDPPAASVTVVLPVRSPGRDTLKLSLNYFYCQTGGEGLCKMGSVVWILPVDIRADASNSAVSLGHKVGR